MFAPSHYNSINAKPHVARIRNSMHDPHRIPISNMRKSAESPEQKLKNYILNTLRVVLWGMTRMVTACVSVTSGGILASTLTHTERMIY